MRQVSKKGVLVLLVCLWAPATQAGLVLEPSFFYGLDSASAGQESSSTKFLGDLLIGATIPKVFFIGWDTEYLTRSLVIGSSTEALSGYALGPKFGLYIGKARAWTLGASFHPLVKLTYVPAGGSETTLSGIGFGFELGFAPQVSKSLYAGFKISYQIQTLGTATTGSTQSNVSYSTSALLPMVYLSFRFGSQ